MQSGHTPNEFPFSSCGSTELLQVPISYSASGGRQLVYTITTGGGSISANPSRGDHHLIISTNESADISTNLTISTNGASPIAGNLGVALNGGPSATASPSLITPTLLADPGGLLDAACNALKQDRPTLVAVEALDAFTSGHEETPPAACGTTAFGDGAQMSPSAELVDAVTQYVQQLSEPRPPPSLMEVRSRSASEQLACFLCDGAATRGQGGSTDGKGLVDMFGESNILAASKTPLCVKLEVLLDTPLQAERVHSDTVCTSCVQLLEDADHAEVRLMALQEQLAELSSKLRQRFTRTVRRRRLRSYPGWEVADEPDSDTEVKPTRHAAAPVKEEPDAWSDTCQLSPTEDSDWAPEDDADDVDDPSEPDLAETPVAMATLTFSVAEDGTVSVAEDAVGSSRSVAKPGSVRRATSKRGKPTMKAKRKVVVPVQSDPSRTRTKYIYEPCHSCDVCGKTFAFRGHLTKHKQTHTGERPLNCHICGKTFRWSSHLTSHLRRHNNERPYVCSICGKAFVSGSVHKSHMRTHTDEKPFMCVVCGKQFGDKSNLKTHEWVHTDQRPHNCVPCGRGFLTTSALKVHNRTVHGLTTPKAGKKAT